MGNENKVRFGILGNEMGFEFLGVFNTPYPTPRPPIVNNENDFDNGILKIPNITFNNDFGFELLFGGFDFLGVLSTIPTPHTIFNKIENENEISNGISKSMFLYLF